MLVITFVTFSLFALASLAGGLIVTARQFAFLKKSYRVQGTVISEWWYSRYTVKRFYRVEFHLRNGQRAELRGSGSRPPIGAPKGVLVREAPGQDPKAQIDDWFELWYAPVVLLGMGGMCLLALAMLLPAIAL